MDATATKPRFAALDGVRAIAVTMVFVSHALSGHFLVDYAWIGVTLFFVLSGFLLYRPFIAARERGATVSLRRYFRRRALRILPAYWLALTVILALRTFPEDSWRLYLLLQSYSPETVFDGIPGAWSLCVEATFYLGLPLYALLVARSRLSLRGELALLLLIGIASMGFRAVVGPTSVWAYATLPGTVGWFAAGMAIACIHAEQPAVNLRTRSFALVAGAIAAYLLLPLAWPVTGPFDPVVPVPLSVSTDLAVYGVSAIFAVCVVLAALPADGPRLLRWAPVAGLGLISYSVFLWHQYAIDFSREHIAPALPSSAWIPVAFLGAIAVASVSYYFVERPVIGGRQDRRQRWLRRDP